MSLDDHSARIIADAVGKRVEAVLAPLDAMTRTIERLTHKMDDVDKRVIRLEATTPGSDIDRLRAEMQRMEAELSNDLRDLKHDVTDLVAWKNRMAGAAGLFETVKSSWPLVVALAVGLVAYLKVKGDLP